MALKHLWIGKIQSSEQFLKRNRNIGAFNSILGFLIFIVSLIIIILNPGGLTTIRSSSDLILFSAFPAFGLILLLLGLYVFSLN
jgi:hypothetical protein